MNLDNNEGDSRSACGYACRTDRIRSGSYEPDWELGDEGYWIRREICMGSVLSSTVTRGVVRLCVSNMKTDLSIDAAN
jgi:hypothetical protein